MVSAFIVVFVLLVVVCGVLSIDCFVIGSVWTFCCWHFIVVAVLLFCFWSGGGNNYAVFGSRYSVTNFVQGVCLISGFGY